MSETFYMLWFACGLCAALSACGFDSSLKEIRYKSSADGSEQPAMFYAPTAGEAVPLLVALHTWSGDYRQEYHEACAEWCMKKGWAYIHPDFRGPNNRPEATGSELVIADIADAVDHAKRVACIDESRVYLVGTSGGGYTALLMAGRHPEIWAGVSAWVPITDLQAWYLECKERGLGYCKDLAASCGGAPGDSSVVDDEYRKRSPLTHLVKAAAPALDINAGIRDGHEGSVPVSHSLRSFNAVAEPKDRLTKEEIHYFVEKAAVPRHLKAPPLDSSFGDKKPLFRRSSGCARITLFEGGHEFIPRAALQWFEKQKRIDRADTGKESKDE